ncbi:hypothetical protein MSG28_006345 [Choristoneura fumiferana]|uniref:Uncharacterized protein n=1 Tax=Choristoneura fumiferana TaxID=7141 RepID=A0ACC0JEG7_CHOFU|nr:hypothetical protein MSG28_006345 [Choristoneura fumiferana]
MAFMALLKPKPMLSVESTTRTLAQQASSAYCTRCCLQPNGFESAISSKMTNNLMERKIPTYLVLPYLEQEN